MNILMLSKKDLLKNSSSKKIERINFGDFYNVSISRKKVDMAQIVTYTDLNNSRILMNRTNV